ncbi:MAG TPA: 50S ribosomal protein L11 methyltransferase [Allosphingosinicella sp.]|jgi:type II protein arginine methyltransferase
MKNDSSSLAGLLSVPGALVKLGCALMGSGRGAQAVALLDRWLAQRPDDPQLRAAARVILSHGVPGWHSPMLADRTRNEAYAAAIGRVVTPQATVLDIGSGSGLLAMMAARAGARRVVACEAHPALAETARQIIQVNGWGDSVEVVGRPSTDLRRDVDLDGGADVIIAEIFSNDLLIEGALPTFRHAAAELAVPGARFIPRAMSIRVALCHREFEEPFDVVAGFDLSLFRRHVPAYRKIPVGDKKLSLRSEAADLFRFEPGAPNLPLNGATKLALTAKGGPANGVCQWIRLQLDPDIAYENAPEPERRSHWAAHFYPLPEGRTVQEGETIQVNAAHDETRLQLWF